MKDLFASEWRRFRRITWLVALLHGLGLVFLSRATNLLQLRRLNLAKGEGADAPAAWVDIDGGVLSELMQHYERTADDAYAYEAKRFDYAATLRVTADSFVRDYPGLWIAEA